MPLPIIAGVVRASYRGLMPSGRQWANVVHCRYAGGASTPGPTEITALDAILARIWTGVAYGSGNVWLGQCFSSVTLIDATYYVLNGTSIPIVIAHAAAGTLVTQTLPPEIAACVTLRGATRGRSNRGRIYLPCPTTTALAAGGNWTTSIVNATVAQVNGVIAALATPQWELGIASYITMHTLHGVSTGVASTPHFTPVSSVTMDVKPDVQRRRK